MSRKVSITEPHPSVPKSGGYIGGGRGGVGNYRRYRPEDLTLGPSASGPASRIPFKKLSLQHTGRGGAGNMFRTSDTEERVFQFDEEMVKRREARAPLYHIGRGGSGNCVDETTEQSRTERLNSTCSAGSTGSDDSTSNSVRQNVGTALTKLTRKFT